MLTETHFHMPAATTIAVLYLVPAWTVAAYMDNADVHIDGYEIGLRGRKVNNR